VEPPLRVVVRRGSAVEAEHLVHGVVVRNGEVIAAAGDPQLETYLRSSAKPFQALALARSYGADLGPRELAIASASHLATEPQLDAVRRLLDRAACDEDDLECGPDGFPPSRLKHNCSGKHAGMLAVCRARRWPTAGYRLPEHPVQRENLADVAAAAGVETSELKTVADGCGVVTAALTLERMARMFRRLESSAEGRLVAAAMRAHPDLIRGSGATDTRLMQSIPGATVKGGAEGLLCGVLPDGAGFALKCADGSGRPLAAAVAALLQPLGYELSDFESTPLTNSRGDVVGEVARSDENR
jgi:L-asparaginase II